MAKKKKEQLDMSIDEILLDSVSEAKRSVKSSNGVKSVSWDNIKTKKVFDKSNSLSDWNNTDFFKYLKTEVESRFKISYNHLSLAGGSVQISQLREKLREFGNRKITNEITKHYIDWFLANRCKDLIQKYIVFKIQYMKYPSTIVSFFKDIDNAPILIEPIILNKKQEEVTVSKNDMKSVYDLSRSSFVKRFGLIFTIVYLMKCHNMNQSNAIYKIQMCINDALKKDPDAHKMIIKSTESYGPYSSDCKFDNIDNYLKELSENTGKPFDKLKIVFDRNVESPDFLRKDDV